MSCENVSGESALVISCGIATPEQVIHHITGVELSPEDGEQNQNLRGFPWSFETKYYSAEITIFALKEKEELDPGFCDSVRAVIFYYDSQKESSFDDVLSWMPYLKDISAEVQLMVCNNSADEADSLDIRKKFLNWCVKNQYELIELNSASDSDDEEGASRSAKGYERVIEALQSHPWANLVIKSKTISNSVRENERVSEDNKDESQTNASTINIEMSAAANAESCRKVAVEGEELKLEEKWLDSVLTGNDPSGDSLEALFGKFASMKEKAESLSGEERKKYAEKVAIAFWQAMDGDKDEIEGLDDSED